MHSQRIAMYNRKSFGEVSQLIRELVAF